MREVRIVSPADPGDAAFDEQGTPFVVFGEQPEHGVGWMLWYLDENGDPVEHFIGGQLDDGGWALTQAREWLEKALP